MPDLQRALQFQGTMPNESGSVSELLLLLVPLLMIAVALIFILIAPFVMYLILRFRPGIALMDGDGPIHVAYEEQLESSGAFQRAYQRWLEQVDDATRAGYELAQRWCSNHPPMPSRDTDITTPQFLGIQEKGVSAWSFDPAYEANQGVMVSARTEIQFLPDSPGMAPEEGGACTIQSNLPLPKSNEVYYWESKIFQKPTNTTIAIGLSTKPYPTFRFPGYCKNSVGIFSQDGFKCYNHPFNAQSYGTPFVKGDVIGVGFRPRTGSVFFTRNGVRMPEAFIGLQGYNLFPTIAADGAAEVHVNFGQAGFVFIEANVKKWGLAPMVGTLAPPPAYGQDKDSVLIEASNAPSTSAQLAADARTGELVRVPPYESLVRPAVINEHSDSASYHAPPPGLQRALSSQGIHLDTLNMNDPDDMSQPPPYFERGCGSPPLEIRTQESIEHQDENQNENRSRSESGDVRARHGAMYAFRNWVTTWRRARRDTSSGTPETPSTELVGVTID